ncbi:MAG: antitoxin [Actinomycetota bacterium]|nr:antitoxin [Actinomycetota bacterium]
MRTTVTLDADVAALLDKAMRERRVTFKQALNDAIRRGLRAGPRRSRIPWTTPSDMGTPTVNLDKALQVAGELEDEDIIRKTRLGK